MIVVAGNEEDVSVVAIADVIMDTEVVIFWSPITVHILIEVGRGVVPVEIKMPLMYIQKVIAILIVTPNPAPYN